MKRTLIGFIALTLVISAFAFRYQLSENAYSIARIDDPLAKGAFHIHTRKSHDGRQTETEVLQAAKMLGLDFVVITDHNLERWSTENHDGLWVIRGPELSLDDGHTIRILNEGEGLDIVAHPGRPRRPRSQPVTSESGVELVNPTVTAEELLYQAPLKFVLSLLTYIAEPQSGLLSLLDVDRGALKLLKSQKPLSLWCGVDAHGWLPPEQNLALWTLQLNVASEELSEETMLQALKDGPTGCFTGLLSDGQPIQVTRNENGAWVFSLKKELAYSGSFRLYRGGELVATSSSRDFLYTPKFEGEFHIEYWVQSRAIPFMSSPQLSAFKRLSLPKINP